MLLLAACFSFLTLAGQRGAMDPAGAHLSWDRILVASSNYGGFLAKAAVPVGLAIVYPQMPGEALLRNGLLGAGLLVLGTLLALGLGRKYPYGPVGWLWYLIYMLPVAGLVQVGAQPTTDRAAYVPMVGIFIVVVWGLGDLVESRPAFRPAVAVACASVLVLLAVQTHLACRYWRDGVTLFARAATVVPGNYQAFSLLGQALEDRGDLPAAEAALREATRLAPWYAEAWGNLANLLARQGRADEAETCYARVLALSPGDPKAANNLGMLLESRGQLQKAEPLYRRALAADAAYLNARVNLSRVLLGEGRVEEAREQARLALRQDPYSDRARQAVAAAEQDRSVPGAKP